MQSDIVERLLAMYSHRGDGIPTQYVNPDGPKAVTEITALRERVAKLEGEVSILKQALHPFAKCCEEWIEDSEDDEEWAKFRLLIGDYRRAFNALSDSPPATDGV